MPHRGRVEVERVAGLRQQAPHGFVGHSVIGEWVNLGALTTTSDLKNNYGDVRVWNRGREHDTRSPKVGALVGAHVKTRNRLAAADRGRDRRGGEPLRRRTLRPEARAASRWWARELMREQRARALRSPPPAWRSHAVAARWTHASRRRCAPARRHGSQSAPRSGDGPAAAGISAARG
jgi:hypothetical protein